MGAFAIWVLSMLSQSLLGPGSMCRDKRCILASAGLPGVQMQYLHLEDAAGFVTCRNTESPQGSPEYPLLDVMADKQHLYAICRSHGDLTCMLPQSLIIAHSHTPLERAHQMAPLAIECLPVAQALSAS